MSRRLASMLLLLLAACHPQQNGGEPEPAPETPAVSLRLSVAVYPWVPRKQQFVDELTSQWSAKYPEIALDFVDWDCYDDDPPANLDVFVFDAIFLDYFADSGYLESLAASEVDDPEDFLAYARDGARTSDGRWWALPQLGCADVLFYREDDEALARAQDFDAIERALGSCTYTAAEPPPDVGLLLDAAGGTTNACRYIDAQQDLRHAYTPTPSLPPADALDAEVLRTLREEIGLASRAQAQFEYEQPYARARAFAEGRGRAMVGFTESMWAMGAARERVDFRIMPLDGEPGVDLFYADVIGVNAKVPAAERAAAVELANMMASTAYLGVVFGPSDDDPAPQYLLPTRITVFDTLMEDHPIYAKMKAMVDESEPHLLRLGPEARPWLESTKSAIESAVFSETACPAPT